MTGWTPDVSPETFVGIGLIQGAGLGFSSFPERRHSVYAGLEHRTEGASFCQSVAQYRVQRRHLDRETLC